MSKNERVEINGVEYVEKQESREGYGPFGQQVKWMHCGENPMTNELLLTEEGRVIAMDYDGVRPNKGGRIREWCAKHNVSLVDPESQARIRELEDRVEDLKRANRLCEINENSAKSRLDETLRDKNATIRSVKAERDTLQAEVERLKERERTRPYEHNCVPTPPKPVVWVRKRVCPDGIEYDVLKGDGQKSEFIYPICHPNGLKEYVKEEWGIDIDVRIWEEPKVEVPPNTYKCPKCNASGGDGPYCTICGTAKTPVPKEPEHEWVYGVWESNSNSLIFCAHKDDRYTGCAYTAEKAIPMCLEAQCGGNGHVKGTPIFGVRELTEEEYRQYKIICKYAPFYKGGILLGGKDKTYVSDTPSLCVERVAKALTPAVALDDLEVVS